MDYKDHDYALLSDSQPATQPLDDPDVVDTDDDSSEDEEASSGKPKPWGILFPLAYNLGVIEMVDNHFSVGRSSQNCYVIFPEQVPKVVNDRISKFQFAIDKSEKGFKLTDRSSNGTEVNGVKIGKGKSAYIKHNSRISLAKHNLWVFIVNEEEYQKIYPREVRKDLIMSYVLGVGGMGEVNLCFRKSDGKRMALKSLKKEHRNHEKTRSDFEKEVNFLKTLKHPNIVRFHSFIETKDLGLYIGLEYADQGDLFHKVRSEIGLDEPIARFLFFQALTAVEYLHGKGIAHRDIKLENFLLCST